MQMVVPRCVWGGWWGICCGAEQQLPCRSCPGRWLEQLPCIEALWGEEKWNAFQIKNQLWLVKKHFHFYILKNQQKNQPRQCFLFLCNPSLPGQSVCSVRNVCALQKPSQVAERDDLTREVAGFSLQWQKVQFVFSLCSRKLFDRQSERRIFRKTKYLQKMANTFLGIALSWCIRVLAQSYT